MASQLHQCSNFWCRPNMFVASLPPLFFRDFDSKNNPWHSHIFSLKSLKSIGKSMEMSWNSSTFIDFYRISIEFGEKNTSEPRHQAAFHCGPHPQAWAGCGARCWSANSSTVWPVELSPFHGSIFGDTKIISLIYGIIWFITWDYGIMPTNNFWEGIIPSNIICFTTSMVTVMTNQLWYTNPIPLIWKKTKPWRM